MKQFWPPAALTADCMCGTCPRLAKSKVLKMLRMDLLNSSLSMVVTLPKSLTSPGIPMILGLFAQSLKITSCKSGKWQRTFTTMRKWTPRPLRLLNKMDSVYYCIMYCNCKLHKKFTKKILDSIKNDFLKAPFQWNIFGYFQIVLVTLPFIFTFF